MYPGVGGAEEATAAALNGEEAKTAISVTRVFRIRCRTFDCFEEPPVSAALPLSAADGAEIAATSRRTNGSFRLGSRDGDGRNNIDAFVHFRAN